MHTVAVCGYRRIRQDWPLQDHTTARRVFAKPLVLLLSSWDWPPLKSFGKPVIRLKVAG